MSPIARARAASAAGRVGGRASVQARRGRPPRARRPGGRRPTPAVPSAARCGPCAAADAWSSATPPRPRALPRCASRPGPPMCPCRSPARARSCASAYQVCTRSATAPRRRAAGAWSEEPAGAGDLAGPQLEQGQHDQGLVGLRRPARLGQPSPPTRRACLRSSSSTGVAVSAERTRRATYWAYASSPDARLAGKPRVPARPPRGHHLSPGPRSAAARSSAASASVTPLLSGGERPGPGRRLGCLLREPGQQQALRPVPFEVDKRAPRRGELPAARRRRRRLRAPSGSPPAGVREGQVVKDGGGHRPLVEGVGRLGAARRWVWAAAS